MGVSKKRSPGLMEIRLTVKSYEIASCKGRKKKDKIIPWKPERGSVETIRGIQKVIKLD